MAKILGIRNLGMSPSVYGCSKKMPWCFVKAKKQPMVVLGPMKGIKWLKGLLDDGIHLTWYKLIEPPFRTTQDV